MKIDFNTFAEYYSKNCSVCNGAKRVQVNEVWTKCLCQHRATLEFRYSQIPVYPEELKYKEWSDFTGEIKGFNEGRSETVGRLKNCGVWAKTGAMKYCFKAIDPESLKDRKNNLIVLNHLRDGQNLIIIGGRNTGKTLLAALVNREIALASFYARRNIDFRWIKGGAVLEASRWDNSKEVDHNTLEDLSEVDFLTIDGVDVPLGGHNTPPDMIALNLLFSRRLENKKPTIVIASDDFYKRATHETAYREITRLWGEEFLNLLTLSTNVFVELNKEISNA